MASEQQEETPAPLLAAATVVCRSLLEIPHIARSISDFADCSCELWTLENLRSHWSYLNVQNKQLTFDEESAVRLQDRLLAREWSGLSHDFLLGRFRYGLKFVGFNLLLLDSWLTKYMPLSAESLVLILANTIEHNRIKVLEWLEQKFLLPSPGSMALQCNRAEAAYWLAKRGHRLSVSVYTELWKNNLEFVKWLHENEQIHEIRDLKEGVEIAMRLNNVEMAQWLITTYPDMNWDEPTDDFIPKHDLKMVKWLEEHFRWAPQPDRVDDEDDFDDDEYPHKQWVKDTVIYAACDGKMDIIKYLYDHPLNNPSCRVIFGAAEGGHMDAVKWLYERQPECAEATLGYAVRSGNLELVMWLHDQLINQFNQQDLAHSITFKKQVTHRHKKENLIDLAVRHDHFELIKWLHEHRLDGCTTFAMDTAAERGKLEIIHWLHANRNEGCTTKTLQGAIRNGHLEIVQWLLENRKECLESISSEAMDCAACQGHLHIVQWLHENRSEGCTANAVNKAAENGQFEVVKFLLENRTEGCTSNAVDLAALNGHFEIVKYLVLSGFGSCTTSTMDNAAAKGHCDIVRWLHNNSSAGCTSHAIDIATKRGYVQIVKFLYQYCDLRCSEEAINFAVEFNHFALLEWVLKHDSNFVNYKYVPPTIIFDSHLALW